MVHVSSLISDFMVIAECARRMAMGWNSILFITRNRVIDFGVATLVKSFLLGFFLGTTRGVRRETTKNNFHIRIHDAENLEWILPQ